jgi:hypothetical protein
MCGTRHAEHFAVSLYSLRKHWDGRIAVIVDPPGKNFCQRFVKDTGIELIDHDHEALKAQHPRTGGTTRSGQMYLAKTRLHTYSPFDRTVYLDADTLVADKLDDLWPQDDGVVLTQFANWTSHEKKVKGRISDWKKVAPKEVGRMLGTPHPAINTGVMAWSKQSQGFHDAWYEMTKRHLVFMCDELAVQLIYPDHRHRLLDERFNCSPIYSWPRHGMPPSRLEFLEQYHIEANGETVRVVPDATLESMAEAALPREMEMPDVVVYHGHGFKFIKKPQGRACWWPTFAQMMQKNWCGIADWTPYNAGPRTRCAVVKYFADPENFN